MKARIRQLCRNVFSIERNAFLRFLLAGSINTLFGFAIYCAAIYAGASVWLALLTGTIIGTVFNFFTTAGYVFRKLTISRFPRFMSCYALVYALNLGLIKLLLPWLGDEKLSQLVLAGPVAVISYLLMARFVFGQGHDSPSAP